MRAHGLRTVLNAHADNILAALQNIFERIVLFARPDHLDRAEERTRRVLFTGVKDIDFIQMDMRINKGRGNEFAVRIDHGFGSDIDFRRYFLDKTVVNRNVDQSFFPTESGILQ